MLPARIYTEGKTDRKHLQAALERLQEQGEFGYLQLEFPDIGDVTGDDELLKLCKNSVRLEPPVISIFMFDRDKYQIVSEVQDKDSYKHWLSDKGKTTNVFSFAIPIPSHRNLAEQVCIEHYYTDNDLKRQDRDKRRLFLSDEFDKTTGGHESGNCYCPQLSRLKKSGAIVDDAVYMNGTHTNIALTKNDFAEHIYNREDAFSNVDFSAFRAIFDMIWQIVESQQRRQPHIFAKNLDYNILRSFNWRRFIESQPYTDYDEPYSSRFIDLECTESGKKKNLKQALLYAINDSSTRQILVSGRPGSGKTFQLNQINAELLHRLKEELENTGNSYLPLASSTIPFLLRLNWADFSVETVSDAIRSEWKSYGMSSTLEAFLESGPKFVFLLDDLDEISAVNYYSSIEEVKRFGRMITRNPDTKVVIAGRPSATGKFRAEYRHFEISDLSQEKFEELLFKYCDPDFELPNEILNELKRYDGLISLFSTPHFVTEIARVWRLMNSGFRVSRLVSHIIEGLIDRQQKTEGDRTLFKWMEDAARVAYESIERDGNLTTEQVKEMGDDLVGWLRQMNFISTSPASSEFANEWLLGYLAMRHIRKQKHQAEMVRQIKARVRDNQSLSQIISILA